ncbi:metallophosphoesterase [Anaeromyxobacter paludicola]|uniref:Metallophosphatase n=1 Tax=Anaeromyxobacter paludicola TaxID=2918171 RepID=A0ABM7XBY5_9BACT|nr:metallophosphoesterase [Anaeromyxobacter paludicola]BDG09348.1 metallophosphatase [Anaeromyxobacter paludicola]
MSRTVHLAIFLSIFVAVLGGIHFYLWARLVRDTGLPGPWRRTLTGLLVLAAASLPLTLIALRATPRLARALAAPVFFWLGLSFILLVALAVGDLARLVAAAASSLAGQGGLPEDPARRLFLGRALAGGAVLVSGGCAAAGTHSALGDPMIHEVAVALPRLPPALSGFTLAQLSDLHAGPTIGEREIRRMAERTRALRPDAVVITGDLVDGSVADLARAVAPLADLGAPHGTWFVTGNHEYYSGAEEWLAALRRMGIRVLANERVALGDAGPGGARFDLAGTHDWASGPFGHGPDLDAALAGRDPERALVLLQHQPRGMGEAVRRGVGLQLSGHTHGGQIVPFNLLVRAAYPYVAGLYRHEEAGASGQIFVSRGAGFWGPPIRLGAPAEIAKIVLTPA